jgi:hypothetical protein
MSSSAAHGDVVPACGATRNAADDHAVQNHVVDANGGTTDDQVPFATLTNKATTCNFFVV